MSAPRGPIPREPDPAVAPPEEDQAEPAPDPSRATAEAEAAFAQTRTEGAKDRAAGAWLKAAQAVEEAQRKAAAPADAQPATKAKRRVHRRLGPKCANPDCDYRIPPVVQEKYRGSDLCPCCAKKRLQDTKQSPEAQEWFRGWSARESTGAAEVREPATVKLANGRTVNAKRASGAPLEPTGESLVDGALRQAGVERRVSAREAGLCRRGRRGRTARTKR